MSQQPTAEDKAKAEQVAAAGVTAAADAPTGEETAAARTAIEAKAGEVGLPLSPEQMDALADLLGNKMLDGFAQRGVFDAPAEPVQGPPQPETAPPPPGEQPAQPAEPQAPHAPEKRNFAQKYFGL